MSTVADTTRVPAREAPDLLERSAELAALEDAFAGVAGTGRGRLVLVAGEAGIGKTELVRAFRGTLGRTRVLEGAADPLQTPRPLGPLVDIAAETGGELARVVEEGAGAAAVAPPLLEELRRPAPSLVVLEDLHWADEATLDLLRLLARRVAAVPALVVATYRDDGLERDHQLRVALGELPRAGMTRLVLPPLSPDAVAQLAEPHGTDAGRLHAITGGNPFYVTEVLAAGGGGVPESVRDAVLARSARLGTGARSLLDAVAIAPPRAELWLLEAVLDGELVDLEECLGTGMLRAERDAVAFRHEIARVAVEEALPPDRRRALHRRALPALAAATVRRVDLARLAHHAEAAGDADAVLRYAPAAGELAALAGAHREAAAQYARALRFAGALGARERAVLLERRSYECYLTSRFAEAIDAGRGALAEHHMRGDVVREADARRWLSRLAWYAGDNITAEAEAAAAVELLETLAPGPELARAYSNLSQLRMLARDLPGARRWGDAALDLSGRLGEIETVVHALNNLGTAELQAGVAEGAAKLMRSLVVALEHGLEDHVARAHTNLVVVAVEARDYVLAGRHLDLGLGYAGERGLEACRLYMTAWRGRALLEQGRWPEAEAAALEVLDHPHVAVPSRITALAVLGRLRARQGDPDPWEPLDEALELALATGEVQRLGPVSLARAEAHWLSGEYELVAADTEHALALARSRGDAWLAGELLVWRRRAGIREPLPAGAVAEPFRLELAGEPEAASRLLRELGCPYDAALALFATDGEEALRRSLEQLQRLEARPAADRLCRRLRRRGVRDLRRGPRATTRENPAGLTTRELEVLELVAAGLRNGPIAEQLVLSAKTVEHHVSAILRKLQAATRTEAAARATSLGILER